MSYIALYRKWRPLTFEDVVEQEHVVKTLRYSVSTGRIAHAYLFCGTRGTGKTTMAHILSRSINCLSPINGDPCNECEICKGILSGSILDILEIDAASNNSVDNVRDIRDEVVYTPSKAKYKVYIIDEVHMLSTGAFNALLKTLEEPPEHVVFILATTEPHKLPATILSRCQRFDFRRITIESIVERLDKIASSNDIVIQRDAAKLIAKMADGALRDAISLLDQCMALGNTQICYNDVLAVVGLVNDTFISDMAEAIFGKDINRILGMIEQLVMDGKDISQFVSDMVLYYRNLLICKVTRDPSEIIEVHEDVLNTMKSQCAHYDNSELVFIIKELSALESSLKWAAHPRILLEVSLIRLCENTPSQANSDLLDRLSALERKVNSGNFAIKQHKQAPISQPKEGAASSVQNSQKLDIRSKPAAKGSPGDFSSLDCWDDVLKDLKGFGRMVLYTNLLGTRAVKLDGNVIGIVFGKGSSFCKMLVSKAENLEVVQDILNRKIGHEVKIKCLEQDNLEQEQKPNTHSSEEDDFVQQAQDIAQRLNVPFNVIDE